MNLLITGVAGFIGTNFVRYALNKWPHANIVGYDNLTYAGNWDNIRDCPITFVHGDINDYKTLKDTFAKYNIDTIINFAAESHVDRSIHDPQIFLKTNVNGTQTLLDVCRWKWKVQRAQINEHKFIQVSTDEVYGSLLDPKSYFSEVSPIKPSSPYAASKASADLLCQAYYKTYDFPVVITRCSNNYGPYQFPEKLIPLMINNAFKHEALPVYGDGKQIRDWIHVNDHCSALDTVLEKGTVGEVYNIGAQQERYNIDVVEKIILTLSSLIGDTKINKGLIKFVKDRPGHDKRYAICPNKIKTLGWRALIPFENGLTATIKWYLEHTKWLDNIISGEYLEFYKVNYKFS
jgi:dTDP-glucose 4,6-dehydratase